MIPDENYIPEEEVAPKRQLNLNDFLKSRSFKISVVIIFSILILLLALTAFFYFSNLNKPIVPSVTPTPQFQNPTPTPVISQSKWATDSGILKERENLNIIETEVKSLDLNEQSLSFPPLNFNINFDTTD